MNNSTIIHVCSFFGIVCSIFWAINGAFLKNYKSVSLFWTISNLFIALGFYVYDFRNINDSFNQFLGFYISDLSFFIGLFFIQFGMIKFFKKEIFIPFILFILFVVFQSFLRFFGDNFIAVLNISFYMFYVCVCLNYLIFKNLEMEDIKTKIFIISPIALCALFMTLRFSALIIKPELYNNNLTKDSLPNTYISLGLLTTIIFINCTLLGVILSSLLIQVNKLANIDMLTKAYNRRYLYQMIKSNEFKQTSYSMLVLDIDFFKKINDSFGHDVGDKVLVEFSKLITSVLNGFNGSTFFRLGGEEFCIVYKTSEKHLVYQLSEAIHEALLNHEWKSGIDYKLTVSIGVTIQDNQNSLKDMLKKSDLALYKAKEEGRNQTIFSF